MSFKSKLTLGNILLATSLTVAVSSTAFSIHGLRYLQGEVESLKVKDEILLDELLTIKSTRPTYDEVDTISKNNSGGIQYIDRSEFKQEFEDKRPGVDLSQPAEPTAEKTKKKVDNCDVDRNRLHWELFAMEAPGCEDTPYKGMR